MKTDKVLANVIQQVLIVIKLRTISNKAALIKKRIDG